LAGPTDYDDLAATYAARVATRPYNALYERPNILALLPNITGRDVLDAGCGPGHSAEWFVQRGARVTGIDLSVRMIEIARERLGDRARLVCGDAGALRGIVTDASLDLVFSSLVVHYIADLEATFAEWARVLRPGGRLVFSTVHPLATGGAAYLDTQLVEERWRWLDGTIRYYRRPLRALTEPLAAAGFVIEQLREPSPSEELRARDPRDFERLSREPAFLFVRARKD